MNNLQTNILQKIKAGEIDMKPKWHHILKAGLLLSGVVLVTILATYLLSFVFYFLHQSGIVFAPGFGFRGLSFFVISSPWLLIGTCVSFLILLYFLVKQYSFSYQRPLLYSMLGVVVFSLLGSWLIQQTTMHRRLGEYMDRHEVPVFSPLYRGALNDRPEGVVVGAITELTETGFLLESDGSTIIEVVVTEQTRMRPGTQPTIGETIMVFGDKEGDLIKAFGLRPSDEKMIRTPEETRKQNNKNMRP